MFPIRTLLLTVALTLSTSVPLAACAQEAPAPEAQSQSATVTAQSNEDAYATLQRQAARMIADRIDSGQRVEEDWTWVGMPPVVGVFNDALLDEWTAAGRPDASGWLDSYAATLDA